MSPPSAGLRRATAPVAGHPRVRALGRWPEEQRRVDAFARDLAAWLAGVPRSELGVLGRVVTAVGGRALRDTRTLCRDLPLLAIEAAARTTETLWPFLRGPDRPPEPPDAPEASGGDGGEDEGEGGDPGDGAGATGGGAGEAPPDGEAGAPAGGEPAEGAPDAGDGAPEDEDDSEDDASDAEEDDDADPEADARAVLEALAGGDADDPDLDALAQALAEADDAAEALSEALRPAEEQAWEGAQESEQLARTLSTLAPGMGWGSDPAQLHHSLSHRLDRLVDLLDVLPQLRELAEQLGREDGDGARRSEAPGGGANVTGVHFAGEVHTALPSELALLGDPETEDLFYQRLLERRLVSLETAGAGLSGVASPERRGPILACIDTSGSMQGAPEAAAKALVLAVTRQALPQKRTVHLLLFGAREEATELRLRRGPGGLEELLDFLAMGFSGGTDFDTPLVRALELLEERDLAKADLLVVTDGHGRAAPEVEAAVRRVREARGVRVFSCLVGTGPEASVAGFSDEVWRVDAEEGESVRLAKRVVTTPRRRERRGRRR